MEKKKDFKFNFTVLESHNFIRDAILIFLLIGLPSWWNDQQNQFKKKKKQKKKPHERSVPYVAY